MIDLNVMNDLEDLILFFFISNNFICIKALKVNLRAKMSFIISYWLFHLLSVS